MSTPENPPSGGDDPGRGLSGIQRASVILGGLAVLLVVFVVLRGGDDNGDSSSSSSQATATGTTASNGVHSTATREIGTSTSTDVSPSTSTSTSTDTEPAVKTITVENGQPKGGIQTISFKKGDQVGFKVQSDVADEIHVHGYDLKKDVEAGGSASFAFEATIEGRFEVELENAGTQIANLEVDPG